MNWKLIASGFVAVSIGLLSMLSTVTVAAAAPLLLTSSPESKRPGAGAGEIDSPFGVAAAPGLPGSVYLADRLNSRVDQFTPWGQFVRAWGWGVGDGSAVFQKCTVVPGCQGGVTGGGTGQFTEPEAIAVGPSGDVYVLEASNHRVQVFDAEGTFLSEFGADVNATKVGEVGASQAEKDLCTAGSGDTCQPGTAGTGPGEFGASGYLSKLTILPTDGSVLVGEGERIQKFSAGGAFLEAIALPAGEAVKAITSDNTGNLYVSIVGQTEVRKLKAHGPTAQFLTPGFQAGRATAFGLAVDSSGTVFVPVTSFAHGNVEDPAAILEFDPSGSCLNCDSEGEGGMPGFDHDGRAPQIIAIAAGSACGPDDVYSTHFNGEGGDEFSFFNVFGEPPDPAICPPPKAAPEITSQFGISVKSREAILGARINPKFFASTTYYLEYGPAGSPPCSAGGCQVAPVPPQTLTSQVTNVPITAPVTVTGLEPETTYHFRFVAQSSGGGPVKGAGGTESAEGTESTFSTFPDDLAGPACPNDAFRTGPSSHLPDCRAYEMVSPVNKEGGDVSPGANASITYLFNNVTLAEAAADGERATFSSLRAFAEPQGAPLFNQYLAVRGPGGWLSTSISPPRSNTVIYPPGAFDQYKSFSEDLCQGWLVQDSDFQLASEAPAGFGGLYRRDNCGDSAQYTSLSNISPPGFGAGAGEIAQEFYEPAPQGHSADGTKTVLRADAKLTANACTTAGIFQIYESWEGPLRLVSVLPNGTATCNHSGVGTFERASAGLRESSLYHAVSEDGERVYWTDSGDSALNKGSGKNGPGTLYLRVNSTQPQSALNGTECTQAARACTLPVSSGSEARFWAATPDGSRALYSEGGVLLSYDLATKSSSQIATGFLGVIGASEDLSRVYLISTQKLSGTQKNSHGDEATAGDPNVYLEANGNFTFVATIGAEEAQAALNVGNPSSPANVQPWLRTSRVSADGFYLAFTSAQSLTGYDNTDRVSGEADSELFLYDAGTGAGTLRCVSCNPTGSRPSGQVVAKTKNETVPLYAAAQFPGWAESLRPTRLLAADGSRLYFESFDALVPRDTNGMRDVYEWERSSGKAECQARGAEIFAPAAGGCLSLISSGTSPKNSELVDVSASGRDVFFATEESLLPQDPGNFDLYDAREGGGFPPAVQPVPCSGEGCRAKAGAPATDNPNSGTPGPDNPKMCPKGTHKATKKGKSSCVKNKSKKHHQKKRHKNKGKKRKSKGATNKSGRPGR